MSICHGRAFAHRSWNNIIIVSNQPTFGSNDHVPSLPIGNHLTLASTKL